MVLTCAERVRLRIALRFCAAITVVPVITQSRLAASTWMLEVLPAPAVPVTSSARKGKKGQRSTQGTRVPPASDEAAAATEEEAEE